MKRRTCSTSFLEEERQHWSELERMHDQIEEGKGCAVASKVEKEICWASSQATMVQQGGNQEQQKKNQKRTEWSIERV